VTGNAAVWIIMLAVACAAVIAVLIGLRVSYRRERRQVNCPSPPPHEREGLRLTAARTGANQVILDTQVYRILYPIEMPPVSIL
jgi:hypothetical protein